MDILFINPSSNKKNYQDLSNKYSAIEPPTWLLLLAESCRSKNFKVGIVDANVEHLSNSQVEEKVNNCKPKLICFVVYGQNVNAGTASMTGAVELSKYLKHKNEDYVRARSARNKI